jgi:hypothetical protein
MLNVFKEFGCTEVNMVGSFVTTKEKPGDLDICWNTTHLDYKRCKKDYPEFFTEAGIEKLRLATGIHLVAFDNYSTDILE